MHDLVSYITSMYDFERVFWECWYFWDLSELLDVGLLGSTLRRNRLVPRGSILNLTRAAACGSYWRLTQHLSTSNTNTDTLTFANVATLPPVRSVFSSNELSQSDHQP